MPKLRRFATYGGVSILTAGAAQAGLAVGYGLLRWTTTAAVVLSLVVSVGPAYWLNRRYVWPDRSGGRTQQLSFAALAIAGSAVAAVTTHSAETLGHRLTDDHSVLTLIVNVTALLTTVGVWLLRFVAFDRLVFTNRRERAALRTQP
jgi:putative flippase GtrA